MASTALIVSTILMGGLLVALAVGSSRLVRGNGYEPQFSRVTPEDRSLSSSEVIGLTLTLVLVAVIGIALLLGDTTLLLFLVPTLAIVGYIAWGTYHMAHTRGLPTAHAIGLSAWIIGVLVFSVIGINLLLA